MSSSENNNMWVVFFKFEMLCVAVVGYPLDVTFSPRLLRLAAVSVYGFLYDLCAMFTASSRP